MSKVRDYKSHEILSTVRIPPTVPFAVRCDGRSFHRLTEELKLEKPYDERLARALTEACRAVYSEGFNPVLAYTFSDEVNLIFYGEQTFEARVEKLISILASVISVTVSEALSDLLGRRVRAVFDGRVVVLGGFEDVVGYLAWRQAECWRNFLNSYAHHILLRRGLTPTQASRELHGKGADELVKIIESEYGSLEKIPTWQRRGILLYRETYLKEAVNKLTGEKILVERRRLVEMWGAPLFTSQEGRELVLKLLEERRRSVTG